MMKGIGIDIVDISRLSEKVADKILCKKEMLEFEGYLCRYIDSEQHVTPYGTSEEWQQENYQNIKAFLKAVGVGIYNGISLTELQVVKDQFGNPTFKDNQSCFLSITHDAGVAVAIVVVY